MGKSGLLAKLSIAGVATAALLVIAGFIIQWRSETPSAAALRLRQIYAQRPAVRDADNALFDAWGFSAPAGKDSREFGRQRIAWIEKVNAGAADADADPGMKNANFRGSRREAMRRAIAACRSEEARACRDAFERVPPETSPPELEALQIARYSAMLTRPAWREIVPLDVAAPLPAYVDVMDGQRLLLLSLRAAAAREDSEAIRATLDRDLKFWRETQKSADILITKMIAVAAIRQHFRYGNLLLRELPADRAVQAIPDSWRVEFAPAERSMLRVFAGELVYFEGMIRTSWAKADQERADAEDFTDGNIAGRLIDGVPRLVPLQYHVNHLAEIYLAVGEGYEVPLPRYEAATRALKAKFARTGAQWTPEEYAQRVGSLEGVRRAALLTVTLRARGAPAAAVADELRSATLRNPFDGAPFEWDANEQAVVYTGPEQHKWRRTEFNY